MRQLDQQAQEDEDTGDARVDCDFAEHSRVPRTGRGGQIAGSAPRGFVGQHRERDGFLGVGIDAELRGARHGDSGSDAFNRCISQPLWTPPPETMTS